MTKKTQLVSVVSTIHGKHFKTGDYPAQNFLAIIENFQPELILVEIRPEAFKKGEYEDGPIEMTYITSIAKEKEIPILGVDWWKEEDIEVSGIKLEKELQSEYENEIYQFGKENEIYKDFSFELLNSAEFQNKVLRIKTINTKWKQDPVWPVRQAWINENSYQAIVKSNAKRALIFVGAEHKAELDAYLSQFLNIEIYPSANFSYLIKKDGHSSFNKTFKNLLEISKDRLEKKLIAEKIEKNKTYLASKIDQIKFILEKLLH